MTILLSRKVKFYHILILSRGAFNFPISRRLWGLVCSVHQKSSREVRVGATGQHEVPIVPQTQVGRFNFPIFRKRSYSGLQIHYILLGPLEEGFRCCLVCEMFEAKHLDSTTSTQS
jgi:hypothetical protein